MAVPFGVSKEEDAALGAVRLLVQGEIDGDVSAALTNIITNALGQGGVRELVVDLDRVSFLAAAGVRALLLGREEAHFHDCAFRVANPRGIVHQVLIATGAAELLAITAAEPRLHT